MRMPENIAYSLHFEGACKRQMAPICNPSASSGPRFEVSEGGNQCIDQNGQMGI
jgi:hypothetical protein